LHLHRGDLRDREELMHTYGIDDVDEIGGPRAACRVLSYMTEEWERKGLWEKYKADYDERFGHALPFARPSVLPLEDYADVYVGRRGREWLENYEGDQPWMLWVSFGGPHEPWDVPEPYASQFDPADMPAPIPRPNWVDDLPEESDTARLFRRHEGKYAKEGGMTEKLARELTANYAGNVSLIDDQIAGMLEAIEARGEMDNTVIVFVSDHGEMNGDRGLVAKSSFVEQAARVPLIVRTPATAKRGGAVSRSPVEWMDIGATFCEMAEAEWSVDHFARSLCAVVDEPNVRPRAVAVSEHGGEVMLCDGRYKAVYGRDGAAYLLFDLEADPTEAVNRVGDEGMGEVKQRLDRALIEHMMGTQLLEPGPRCHWWQVAPGSSFGSDGLG